MNIDEVDNTGGSNDDNKWQGEEGSDEQVSPGTNGDKDDDALSSLGRSMPQDEEEQWDMNDELGQCTEPAVPGDGEQDMDINSDTGTDASSADVLTFQMVRSELEDALLRMPEMLPLESGHPLHGELQRIFLDGIRRTRERDGTPEEIWKDVTRKGRASAERASIESDTYGMGISRLFFEEKGEIVTTSESVDRGISLSEAPSIVGGSPKPVPFSNPVMQELPTPPSKKSSSTKSSSTTSSLKRKRALSMSDASPSWNPSHKRMRSDLSGVSDPITSPLKNLILDDAARSRRKSIERHQYDFAPIGTGLTDSSQLSDPFIGRFFRHTVNETLDQIAQNISSSEALAVIRAYRNHVNNQVPQE